MFVRKVAEDWKIRCVSAGTDTWPIHAHHIQVLACSGPILIASTAVLNPSPLLTATVERSGRIEIATIMTVTLSCDHRVVDGALGAQLISAFKALIEQPVLLAV